MIEDIVIMSCIDKNEKVYVLGYSVKECQLTIIENTSEPVDIEIVPYKDYSNIKLFQENENEAMTLMDYIQVVNDHFPHVIEG
jgi:hypothetical protein